MSTSDQAKSKLLDSMRASKQGTTESPVAEESAPEQTTSTKEAAPASKAKAAQTTKKAAKPAASKPAGADSFQAAKRVWPD